MRHVTILGLLMGALAARSAAAAGGRVWLRAADGEVELITTAGAEPARTAMAEIGALRRALAEAAPWLVRNPGRLRIVAFSGEEEFAQFRVNAHSPAWFVGGPGWSAIVMGRLDRDAMPALRHEFVHHLLRSAGCRLPLWLEEGLADALSSLLKREAERRVRLLRGGTRLSWDTVMMARPGAALYNDWGQARMFYAQSWALAEALIHSSGGKVEETAPAEWAALGPKQKDVANALLRRFLKRPRPAGRQWKLEAPFMDVEVEPAPAGLVWTVLGRLSLQLGRMDAAEAYLRKAELVWPESLPLAGDLEYRRGRLVRAREIWRRAMALDVADTRTLLRLAVLEQDLPGGEMTPVLERLLDKDPSQEEARLALASQYIRRGLWLEARQRLSEVRSAPPRWANFYEQALALVRMKTADTESTTTN